MTDHEIRLIITDKALRMSRTLLTVGMMSGSGSPLIEPMSQIIQAVERGDSTVLLQLKEERK